MRKNKDKYMGMSPTKRFFHKYTGFIICGILMTTIVPYLIWDIQSREFFEGWGCNAVSIYVLLGDTSGKYPNHDELTEAQHVKLHEIMKECPFHGTIMEHDYDNVTPKK